MAREQGTIRRALLVLGGVAAVLGLYWDDAWHTDVGRDEFLSPPHLLLYAGVAVLLLVPLSWAWERRRGDGPSVLRDPLLLLPLGGAAVTLGSAPIDELWHQLFGRDAVVWSPPHVVAVAGLVAFAAGLLLALHTEEHPAGPIRATVGAFLIAALGTLVMEFEADVPQFPIVTYLPVHVATLTFALALIRRASGRAWSVTPASAIYVLLRLVVVGFLAVLGHSLPTVMPTVVAAAVFDVGCQRRWSRPTLAGATSATVVVSHASAHMLQPTGLEFTVVDLAAGLSIGTVTAWMVLSAVGIASPAATSPRTRRVFAMLLVALAVLGPGTPVRAHDPGQGVEVAPVTLIARRSGDVIELELDASEGSCSQWQPERVLARRAGRALEGAVVHTGGCTYRGWVRVDRAGRWFVYAEVDIAGRPTETWIPVVDHEERKETSVYTAPRTETPLGQVVAAVTLYLVAFAILAVVVVTYRQRTPRRAPAAAAGRAQRSRGT